MKTLSLIGSVLLGLVLGAMPILPAVAGPIQRQHAAVVARKNAAGGGGPATPLVWWKTNEGMGTDLTGDGSTADDGTTDADWATGQSGSGGSLDFNGSSDDAQTDSTIAYGTNIITVMFWFRPDTLPGVVVLGESSSNFNSNNNSWVIFTDGSSQLNAFMCGTAGVNRSATKAGLSAATWYHVAIVFDGSATDTIKIYLDGTNQSVTPVGARGSTANFATYTLYVGARGASSLFYDGKIDDYRIYTGEVSSGDIATIYAANSQ